MGVSLILLIYLLSARIGLRLLTSKNLNTDKKALVAMPLTLLSVVFVAGLFEDNLSGKGNLQHLTMALCVAFLLSFRTSRKMHQF